MAQARNTKDTTDPTANADVVADSEVAPDHDIVQMPSLKSDGSLDQTPDAEIALDKSDDPPVQPEEVKRVRALRSINLAGHQRMTGEVVEVDDEVAAYLVPAGQVALVDEGRAPRAGKHIRTAQRSIPETR